MMMITFFTCWFERFFVKYVWLLRGRKRDIAVVHVVRRGLHELRVNILTIISEILNANRISNCCCLRSALLVQDDVCFAGVFL